MCQPLMTYGSGDESPEPGKPADRPIGPLTTPDRPSLNASYPLA
jgi:hypothetical protein